MHTSFAMTASQWHQVQLGLQLKNKKLINVSLPMWKAGSRNLHPLCRPARADLASFCKRTNLWHVRCPIEGNRGSRCVCVCVLFAILPPFVRVCLHVLAHAQHCSSPFVPFSRALSPNASSGHQRPITNRLTCLF